MKKILFIVLPLFLSVGFCQQMLHKQSMIMEDGLQTQWYENGQKKAEINYKDGKGISSKCWDEDGKVINCSELK